MTDDEELHAGGNPAGAARSRSGERRPYQPPRILHREPLEVMAAVCAPAPPAKGNQGLCPTGPISS